MVDLRLSGQKPHPAWVIRASLPVRSDDHVAARRVEFLNIRDHRDDGSVLGGLFAALVLAAPVWALIVALIVALL